jgi:hypothetical protein
MKRTMRALLLIAAACAPAAAGCGCSDGGGGEGDADTEGWDIEGLDEWILDDTVDGDPPDVPDDSPAEVPDGEGDPDSDDIAPCTCPEGFSCEGGVCTRDCDVLVVGEGMGGTAAALASASSGVTTCLVAFQEWLGGQATSQGVSALDEGIPWTCHPHFSADYARFRHLIRQFYLDTYSVVDPLNNYDWEGAAGFDPGSCWVSRLCFEPQVGAAVLDEMAAPLLASGDLVILRGLEPTGVLAAGGRIDGAVFSATLGDGTIVEARIRSAVTIDATELGDLIALGAVPCRTGAEDRADTGETHARDVAGPDCVQPFTYTFILERRPSGEDHTIAVPPGYDASRYSLTAGRRYYVFDDPDGNPTFWTYRRLIAAGNFNEPAAFPYDLAMINWGPDGNDYDDLCLGDEPSGCNIVDKSPADTAAILQLARDYTLGFVYWLQHDAPRDDGGCCGYPNLLLRTDIFPTSDGLSPYPYIREARRIRAIITITEEDIREDPARSRAVLFDDSVGTNLYGMDLHQCAGGDILYEDPTWSGAMLPAQIPLRALIPESVDGFLAAAKDIGTTHLSNGAYRLHPSEWHIGEAAGTAAAMAAAEGIEVRQIAGSTDRLRALQHALVTQRGMPIFWWSDLGADDGVLFAAANMVAVENVMTGYAENLLFDPAALVSRGIAAVIVARLFDLPPVTDCHPSFSDVPCTHALYGYVQALADAGITAGCGGGAYCVDDPATRGQLAAFIVRAAGWTLVTPAAPSYSDVPAGHPLYSFIETGKENRLFEDETTGSIFRPDEPAARADAAMFSYNIIRSRYGLW